MSTIDAHEIPAPAIVFPCCPRCRPQEWPSTPVAEHPCAANDEDGTYGTIVVSRPRRSGGLHDRYISRTWPVCPECEQVYCTWCGAEEWYQVL